MEMGILLLLRIGLILWVFDESPDRQLIDLPIGGVVKASSVLLVSSISFDKEKQKWVFTIFSKKVTTLIETKERDKVIEQHSTFIVDWKKALRR